jgi:hypothetical protein
MEDTKIEDQKLVPDPMMAVGIPAAKEMSMPAMSSDLTA